MKAFASILLIALLPLNLSAAEVIVLKFEDLNKLIQKNSKEVKAAELFSEASATKQGYVQRSKYPRLDIESGLRGVKEVNGSGDSAPFLKIEGSVSLYRGNRDALKDAIQEKETLIRKAESQLVSMDQLRLARLYFVKLASVRRLVKAWQDAVEINNQQKKSARLKANAGLTTNTDFLEFDLHGSSLKREKRKLDKEDHEVSNRLRLILGLNEDAPIKIDKDFIHPQEPKESNFSSPKDSHPMIRKLAIQSEQARTIAASRSSSWTPDIDLFARYEGYLKDENEVLGSLPSREIAAGIRLSIPIGDNLSFRNEAFSKNLEASAYELQKQQSLKEVEATFHEYFHDMNVLHDLIHDSDEQLTKAKTYMRQTRQEYERGLKNGPDVLEASRMLYKTEVENIELIFDYYLAEAGIASLIFE